MTKEVENSGTTRRTFLGAAALTAASYNRVLGAHDRIGIGQVGVGLIGKQHIADFKTHKDVDIVALCDAYAPRVEEGLKYIGNGTAKGYADFRKMYENKDIDGVVVATPDHWHALLTIMACAAGKDVYVEKPMAGFIDQGKWMGPAARQHERIVTGGTQRRQGAGVKAAKQVIQAGTLGKIHSVRIAFCRNIYPGFGKTPVTDPPPGFDYDMWLLAGPQKPPPAPPRPFPLPAAGVRLRHVAWAGPEEALPGAPRPLPLPLVLGLFGRPDDQPGSAYRRPDPVAHGRQRSDQRNVHRRPVRAGRRRRRDSRLAGRDLGVSGQERRARLHAGVQHSRGQRRTAGDEPRPALSGNQGLHERVRQLYHYVGDEGQRDRRHSAVPGPPHRRSGIPERAADALVARVRDHARDGWARRR